LMINGQPGTRTPTTHSGVNVAPAPTGFIRLPTRNPAGRIRSRAPTALPTTTPTVAPSAVPTAAPSAVPTAAPVTVTLTQVIVGMSSSRWRDLNGDLMYRNTLQTMVKIVPGVASATVVVNSGSFATSDRRLQSSGSGSSSSSSSSSSQQNVQVTAAITISPGTAAVVQSVNSALLSPNAINANPVTSQLRLQGPDWAVLQAQNPVVTSYSPASVVATLGLTLSPVQFPTLAPTNAPAAAPGAASSNSNGNSASGTVGGLPTDTLVAVVVVLVVVVLAAGVVAFRNSGSGKNVKTVVVDPYGLYNSSGNGRGSNGSFSSISPVHGNGVRRPSYGSPQNHRAGQPPSSSRTVEMTDTYGVSAEANYGRPSQEANPAFGSSRLSSGGGRASFSGDMGGGRRSSFEGMQPRQGGQQQQHGGRRL